MSCWPDGVPALIPAYKPGAPLLALARDLVAAGCPMVIAVDDGSGQAFAPIFAELGRIERVTVLAHPINLGKGAALKTGFAHAISRNPPPMGVVTLDADGQHLIGDAAAVARRFVERPDALVLGARQFRGDVPWRSKVGNTLTQYLYRAIVGDWLSDTQTGLRAVPRSLMPVLLRLPADRYEFELDMLLQCESAGVPIAEQPIAAVYLQDNRSSHFNPLFDSLRIYFALFRFVLSAALVALIDLVVFWLTHLATGSLIASMALGRSIGALVNFGINRRFVFLHRPRPLFTLAKYLALVATFGLVSYAMVDFLSDDLQVPVIVAKLFAEGILFLFSFLAQRDVVFPHDARGGTRE
jgi:putative flippase GtrA